MTTPKVAGPPVGWDRHRVGLDPDVGVYSLAPWPVFERAWLARGRTLCWGGGRAEERRLSGPRDQLLRDFTQLHRHAPDDRPAAALRLAKAYGPLGLCARHQQPVAHLSREMVRSVQAALDHLVPTGGEDGDWWRLSPCDLREPPAKRHTMPGSKPIVVATRAEPVSAWVHWSRVISGVIAVAWSVQKGQGTDLAEWRLLDPMLPTRVDFMAPWTDRYDEDRVLAGRSSATREWLGVPVENIESIEDLGDGRVRVFCVDVDGRSTVTVRSPSTAPSRAQRRRATAAARATGPTYEPMVDFGTYSDPSTGEEISFVADGSGADRITYVPYDKWSSKQRKASLDLRGKEIQRTQKRMLSKIMDDLIRLADLRAHFDWDERPAARLTYGGGTLFGALIAQLTLTIGGVNAFAVCDFCRTTWQPEQWPRGGPNDNTLCEAHQNAASAAMLRRRVQHAGSLAVATKRRSKPNL